MLEDRQAFEIREAVLRVPHPMAKTQAIDPDNIVVGQPSNHPDLVAPHQHSLHTYIHTYIHTCIHTSIHTCMHAYIHTYIHTCMSRDDIKMTVDVN